MGAFVSASDPRPGKNLSLAWAGSGVSLRCCSLCDKKKHREGHVAEELLSAVREGMLDNRSGSSSQSEGLPSVGGGGGDGGGAEHLAVQ